MLSNIESQVTSLENAMETRGRGDANQELTGAYGRQAYESLGGMLREVQDTSSAMANRVQVLDIKLYCTSKA